MIEVFLVAGDLPALSAIQAGLTAYSDICIVGTAQTAAEALAQITLLKPAVICSTAHLSDQTCLALVAQIMEHQPTPILILSGDNDPILEQDLLAVGVVEVLVKPAYLPEAAFAKELSRKLKVLSGVMVFGRAASIDIAANKLELPVAPSQLGQLPPVTTNKPRRKPAIVVIGASTGGPHALERVLSKLPADYPLPIVCIQHISQGFLAPFILWLSGKVKLPVSIAIAGQLPENGHIYFAPDHANLEFDQQGRFRHSHGTEFLHYPCVNVTFNAAAKFYANHTLAVLLTGMGEDGADGLQAIAQAGGVTIAQDEASSAVFGMPKAAIEKGAAQQVLNLEEIFEALHKLGRAGC
ncbi:MAG: chemotaxis protein CheB [Methylovulum sp.]|nr:chemotaxis protein CheB [Methylovulum sp.]